MKVKWAVMESLSLMESVDVEGGRLGFGKEGIGGVSDFPEVGEESPLTESMTLFQVPS